MREIKFRAWDKPHKVMSIVKTLHFDTGVCQLYNDKQYNRFFGSFEIMQFTGIKDKNGKEIYEGDIIQHPNPDCKAIVKFGEYNNNEFYEDNDCGYGWYLDRCLTKKSIFDVEGMVEINLINVRVIGNIYENLELLKETK